MAWGAWRTAGRCSCPGPCRENASACETAYGCTRSSRGRSWRRSPPLVPRPRSPPARRTAAQEVREGGAGGDRGRGTRGGGGSGGRGGGTGRGVVPALRERPVRRLPAPAPGVRCAARGPAGHRGRRAATHREAGRPRSGDRGGRRGAAVSSEDLVGGRETRGGAQGGGGAPPRPGPPRA